MALNLKNIAAFIFIISAFAFLLKLGFWQTERLSWKNEIIEKLDAEYQNNPTQNFLSLNDLQNMQPGDIHYGSVKGVLQASKMIFKGPKPLKGKIGYDVISPLKTQNGYVLINRGWVEERDQAVLKEQKVQIAKVSGVFRYPDWNRFTPNNNPDQNVWTKLDVKEMALYFDAQPVVPIMLFMIENEAESALIISQDNKWYPRNKHAQYAIFWFSMAFLLIILSALTFRKKL